MNTSRLTQRQVDEAELSKGKLYEFLWDPTLAGFGVRITKGRKAYVVQYREGSRTIRQTIGQHPTIGLVAARNLAHGVLYKQSPPPPIKDAPHAHTVGELMSLFLSEYIEKRHKTTTIKEERRLIEKLILPQLGELPLTDLNRSTVIAFHAKQSANISANRALAHLSKACSFALQRGWMDNNPCKGIERNREASKDRYFTDTELQRIGLVAREQRKEIYDCICLLALTGLRSGEVLQLTDDMFDPLHGIIRFADTKTGPRTVALLPEATNFCQIIDTNIKHRMAATRTGFSKAIIRVLEKADVKRASAHTFRHTLATYMAQHGDSIFQIAAMGGWTTLSMVQRYVSLHGVGTKHPTPAGLRIARAMELSVS